MRSKILILLCLFSFVGLKAQNEFSLSGYIKDKQTGEDLIGAALYFPEISKGVTANVYGYYSISLPQGTYQCRVSFVGYETQELEIVLDKNIEKTFELGTSSEQLKEVEVSAKRQDANVNDVQMSTINMSMNRIKKIPAVFGEVDVIKAIQLLPGVAAAGEGLSGFFVRGGAADQNLILLDEALVYNSSHLLGFFSVFNPDAIKDVQLYKGGIPSRFGGRLASVLDVRMKDGNSKKFTANGGIGLIASRLTLETPIVKDKGSILISGRRTYADAFLVFSKNESLKNSELYFYDFNLKANYKLSDKDRLYASGYFGRDKFGLNGAQSFGINWGNATGTLRWNHLFNQKWFSNVTLIRSDYDYGLLGTQDEDTFEWTSKIRDYSLKADLTYFQSTTSTWRFGAQATHHTFTPGNIDINNRGTRYQFELEKNQAMEYGIYVDREHEITPRLKATYGIRVSRFDNVGDQKLFAYDNDFNISDTTQTGKGVFNTYYGIEPRIGARYTLDTESSVKASYNRTYQYVQIASNSTGSSPLDVYFSASPNVKPQSADQVAVGYFRNLKENTYEASVELYYKWMDNTIDFKNQAQLLLNEALEGELRIGTSKAYGAEFLVRKNEGKFTGFVSYTLSRVTRNIDVDESLPGIEEYLASYDKTHDIAVVASYELNKKWSFGGNFIYGTGNAITMPTGKYFYKGSLVPVYSDRNGARMEPYHRLDLSATLKNKVKEGKRWQSEWVFSIYNVYSRKNPYTYSFTQDDEGTPVANKVYLFPIIPSVTYNFKF